MSSILLSNPFAPPSPVTIQAQDIGAALAVPPAPSVGKGDATGDSTGFAGAGGGRGTSNQRATVALFQGRGGEAWARPADATGRSVIGAQAQDNSRPLGPDLPEVAMPDPLPTSPFLKRAGEGS